MKESVAQNLAYIVIGSTIVASCAAASSPATIPVVLGVSGLSLLSAVGQNIFGKAIIGGLDGSWNAVADRIRGSHAGQPVNHDLMKAMRRAHLNALRFYAEQVRVEAGKHPTEFDQPAIRAFRTSLRQWINAQNRTLKTSTAIWSWFRQREAPAQLASQAPDMMSAEVEGLLAHLSVSAPDTPTTEAAAILATKFADATIAEIRSFIGGSLPEYFESLVRGTSDARVPSMIVVASAFFAEAIKKDDRAYKALLFSNLEGLGQRSEEIKRTISEIGSSIGRISDNVSAIHAEVEKLNDAVQASDERHARDADVLKAAVEVQSTELKSAQKQLAEIISMLTRAWSASWRLTEEKVEMIRASLATDLWNVENIVEELDEFLDGGHGSLCVVTAEGGGGKSSILSRWIDQIDPSEVAVVFHFANSNFSLTTSVDVALSNLISQVCAAGNTQQLATPPLPDLLADQLYTLLSEWKGDRKLLVVLDGLDELQGRVEPFVGTGLPENVFVVVSARAGPSEAPRYVRDWLPSGRRLVVEPFNQDHIASSLQSALDGNGVVLPDPGKLPEIARKINDFSSGTPLLVRLIIEDIVDRLFHNECDQQVGEVSIPSSLNDYLSTVWTGIRETDSCAGHDWLIPILAAAKGPLSESAINAIRSNLDPAGARIEPLRAPFMVARWISASGERPVVYRLIHGVIADAFAGARTGPHRLRTGALGAVAADAEKAIVAWAVDQVTPDTENASIEAGAEYAAVWVIDHLLDRATQNVRQQTNEAINRATEICFTLPWIEAFVSYSSVYELIQLFEKVAIQRERLRLESLSLRLILEALRVNLPTAQELFARSRSVINQVVQNRLMPLLSDDQDSVFLSSPERELLLSVLEAWRAHSDAWVRLEWPAQAIEYHGKTIWQSSTPSRQVHYASLSPDQSKLLTVSREWGSGRFFGKALQEVYEISVFNSATGELAARLRPRFDERFLSMPDPGIPRPAAFEEQYREYFRQAAERNERPPKTIDTTLDPELLFKTPTEEPEEEVIWNPGADIGKGWLESIWSGDAGGACWLTDHIVAASTRGGRIFLFDVLTREQVAFLQLTNVSASGEIVAWDGIAPPALERLSDTTFLAGAAHLGLLRIAFDDGKMDIVQTAEVMRMRKNGVVTELLSGRSRWIADQNCEFEFGAVSGIRRSPNSALFAVVLGLGQIGILDPELRTSKLLMAEQAGELGALSWSPCSQYLIARTEYDELMLWEVRGSIEQAKPRFVLSDIVGAFWEETANLRCIRRVGGRLENGFVDVVDGTFCREGRLSAGPHSRWLELKQQGRCLLIGPHKTSIAMVEIGRVGFSIEPQGAHSHASVLRPSGMSICYSTNKIATVGQDGIRIWHLNSGDLLQHVSPLTDEAYDREVNEHAMLGEQYDVAKLRQDAPLIARHAGLGARSVGNAIITINTDAIRYWYREGGNLVREIQPVWEPELPDQTALHFSPNGEFLAMVAGMDVFMFHNSSNEISLAWKKSLRLRNPNARYVRTSGFTQDGTIFVTDDQGNVNEPGAGVGYLGWATDSGESVDLSGRRQMVVVSRQPLPTSRATGPQARRDNRDKRWWISYQDADGVDHPLPVTNSMQAIWRSLEPSIWIGLGEGALRPSKLSIVEG